MLSNVLQFYVCLPCVAHGLVVVKGLVSLNEAMSHATQGHPRRMGHSGEFCQNVIYWRKEWQTTPVFWPQELHELCKNATRYDTER